MLKIVYNVELLQTNGLTPERPWLRPCNQTSYNHQFRGLKSHIDISSLYVCTVCSHVCSLSGVFVVIFRPYVAFLAKNWKVGWLKWRMGCL